MTFLDALRESCEGRHKAIVYEALGDLSESAAKAELSKYLSGERGDRFARIIDAIAKLGHREPLIRWAETLRGTPADALVEIRDELPGMAAQLELFGAQIIEIQRRIERAAEVIPMERALRDKDRR